MSAAPTTANWKRRTNICLIAAFLTLLWLPTLDTFFHFDHSSIPGENRLLAELPKIKPGSDGLKSFFTGLENYFNDHFGFRKLLIWSHRGFTFHVFNDLKGHRAVVVGSEGWLYFNENQMVEHYRGTLSLTPDQLQDWKTLLEYYRDSLAQRGIKFLFVVVPDKQSIYPEFLPSWMNKVSPETKLDQFFAYMKTHSTVDVLDMRQTLLEGRATGPMYLRTDTHWNQLGAFLAYQKLVNELAVQHFPGAKPMPLDAFERTNLPAPPGDLAAMAGTDSMEINAVFFKPKPPAQSLEAIAQPNISGTPFATSNPNAGGTAFVYGDSFVNNWVPFLGYNFGQVYYFKNNFLASSFMDPNVFEQQRPAVVIIEVVERYFNVVKPKELLAEEKLK